MAKGQMRITVPDHLYSEWGRGAALMGVSITTWLQLHVRGVLRSPTHAQEPQAIPVPVQEPIRGRTGSGKFARPEGGWMRERIMRRLAAEGRTSIKRGTEIVAMASREGVMPRTIYSAINSMVNSGRAELRGGSYHLTDKALNEHSKEN